MIIITTNLMKSWWMSNNEFQYVWFSSNYNQYKHCKNILTISIGGSCVALGMISSVSIIDFPIPLTRMSSTIIWRFEITKPNSHLYLKKYWGSYSKKLSMILNIQYYFNIAVHHWYYSLKETPLYVFTG